MTFIAGRSGNPNGRPKGAGDKRTEMRSLLEPHAPALIEKAVQMALAGDVTALKLCLDRIIPVMRSAEPDKEHDLPIKFVLTMGKKLEDTAKDLL
ncbi:MAG: DUF5681 domain-containing protein [Pseudomonadota bacterium]